MQKSIRRVFRALAVAVVALAPLAVTAPGAVAQTSNVLLPPVMKVDLQGKRIDGAAWDFTLCRNWDETPDPQWTCDLGEWYEKPLIGDTRDGFDNGGNWLTQNLETRGSTSPTPTMVITVWETAAPTGYITDTTKHSYSYMCGAWVPGDAVNNPGLTCDPDALPAGTLPRDGTVPILLTNRREVPRLHSTPPLLVKVDQAGATLKGAQVQGWHCTRWDNDLTWTCDPLGTEPTIDPGAWPTYLQDEMPYRIPETPTMSEDYDSNDRIIVWERAAPSGYTLSTTLYAVHYVCGAWRTIPVTGRTAAAALAPPAPTCDSPVLKDNTFRWVNTKIVTPTTTAAVVPPMTTKPAATTPAPTAPTLPQSGLPHEDLGAYVAWCIALILGGAVLTATGRRRTQ